MNCCKCGKYIEKSYGGMCQGCYNYFKKGGTIHELPAFGELKHDEDGKVICHICGRSYARLGSHVRESHEMTIDEYKEEFGLCRNAKTTAPEYSVVMRQHAYDNEMDKRLSESGKNTQIKKGQNNMRKGKPVRMQEILEKRMRGKANV